MSNWVIAFVMVVDNLLSLMHKFVFGKVPVSVSFKFKKYSLPMETKMIGDLPSKFLNICIIAHTLTFIV